MGSKQTQLISVLAKLASNLTTEEKEVLVAALTDSELIPVSIFSGDLSGLESLVLYLKEEKNKTVTQIASVLNRNKNTIYTTLKAAHKKKGKLILEAQLKIPISIFSNRKFSILESLVVYLKETKGLTLKAISELTKKHYSTIKTTYWRAKKK